MCVCVGGCKEDRTVNKEDSMLSEGHVYTETYHWRGGGGERVPITNRGC